MIMEFTLATGPMEQFLEKIGADAAPTVARAMNIRAEMTMTRSKAEFVPVDTGALRSSGKVDTEVQGTTVTTQLGYGGAAKAYAVIVHEVNKNYRGGRQYKYLETPLKEDISSYSDFIAGELLRSWQGS